ncbi:MAG TPA: prepilin-type N-terminal cleavage/methylation domain-containing protein [Jatrophihabitans sp.]|nr:prepilin-type N-terminal cleavage/methylation domain-containing protein [Jatrophihabitans sp.]
MLQRIRKVRAVEAGFTLIELLIVVVILGVLAGIVVFAVSAFNNDGVTAACRSDVKNVEIASEAYYAKTGTWAANIAALAPPNSNYLKEAPNSTKYTVNYTAGSGTTESTVTGTITGGGTC